MIGRTLSRYKILEEVGQGGMAVVYKGLDTSLGREVAVKVLHPHLAGLKESRDRLEREAQAVAKLRHENILEIFDYSGPDSPERFLVTEFVHGPTLTAFLKDHPPLLPEVAEMVLSEVARALEHAHAAGVIHRDVKPENILITQGGLIKLADFGIAHIVDKERMTVTGQLLGSPAYMSPEHVNGGRLDFRTDVFACGILLYQLATGQLPFRGKNPHEVLKKIADCIYTPPGQVNPLVSPALGRTIARALAKRPDDRFPDVAELRAELLAELAACGIDDPRGELSRYFAAPADWARVFRPKLVRELAAQGKRASGAGKRAAALAAWSRALTIDPANLEVKDLVASLASRRRGAWAVAAVAGVLLVGGGGWALHALGRARPPVGVVVPVAGTGTGAAGTGTGAAGTGTGVAGTGTGVADKVAGRDEARAHHPAETKRVRVAPVKAAERELQVSVSPKKATVRVDTNLYGEWEPGKKITLAPGPHVLSFHNDCCADQVVPVAADQTELDVTLPWKRATLSVHTEPKDATVTYRSEEDRDSKNLNNGRALITFPSTRQSGTMKVHLIATAPGYHSAEKDCEASAGAQTSCDLQLAKVEE